MHKKIIIGTRGSNLALWQTQHIRDLLLATHPGLEVEKSVIITKGDKIQNIALPQIGGKGLFTEAIEKQLLEDKIHIAVHSLKDLPSELPEGLIYAGSPKRANFRDAFISKKWNSLAEVKEDGVIATGSTRRKVLLMKYKPNAQFPDLRGNVETRLNKLEKYGWDGIIMAAAALERLGKQDLISEFLPPESFVPAVGQGAIGIEINEKRNDIKEIVQSICDQNTMYEVMAERAFMKNIAGGCSVPVGAWARIENNQLILTGFVGSCDGKKEILASHSGSIDQYLKIGTDLATRFIEQGARELLS